MYKDVLRSIADVHIFAVVGLSIFMVFFLALIVYVLTMKKEYVHELSMLPCNDDELDKPAADKISIGL